MRSFFIVGALMLGFGSGVSGAAHPARIHDVCSYSAFEAQRREWMLLSTLFFNHETGASEEAMSNIDCIIKKDYNECLIVIYFLTIKTASPGGDFAIPLPFKDKYVYQRPKGSLAARGLDDSNLDRRLLVDAPLVSFKEPHNQCYFLKTNEERDCLIAQITAVKGVRLMVEFYGSPIEATPGTGGDSDGGSLCAIC